MVKSRGSLLIYGGTAITLMTSRLPGSSHLGVLCGPVTSDATCPRQAPLSLPSTTGGRSSLTTALLHCASHLRNVISSLKCC